MKACKYILPIVALFLVHGASATFGLWNSERIRNLFKYKINQLHIPLITPTYPLFNHDYPIFRYYFLKPTSTKNIYLSNTPANTQFSIDNAFYDASGADTQTTDLPYVNMVGQYGSTYVYPEVNSDSIQGGSLSNGGITGEYENTYIYPTVNNDNIQVDGVSYDGIVGGYESSYVYPTVNNDNTQVDSVSHDAIYVGYENGYVYPTINCDVQVDGQLCHEITGEYENDVANTQTGTENNVEVTKDCECGVVDVEAEPEAVTENTDESVNPESDIDVVVENVGESGFVNTEDDTDTVVVDADENSFINENIITEADNEPIEEDADESDFVDAEPDTEAVEVDDDESDFFDAQDDLDEYLALYNSQTDHSDTDSVKGYDNSFTDTETTNGNDNSINSNIDYYPQIDIRTGDTDVEDYEGGVDDTETVFQKNIEV